MVQKKTLSSAEPSSADFYLSDLRLQTFFVPLALLRNICIQIFEVTTVATPC